MIREETEGLLQVAFEMQPEKDQHRGQDQKTPPLVLLHRIADEGHGEGQQGPEKPGGVVAEHAEAVRVEGHLDQINQRLADQEEDEDLQRGVQRAFAVHDDQDREEDPPFEVNGDILERCVFCKGQQGGETGIQAADHGKGDQPSPGEGKTAEEFFHGFASEIE